VSAAARGPAVRAILAPFAAAKLLALVVPLLVVYSTSNTPGFPTRSELANAYNNFAAWDGQSYITIAEHGYPEQLDLTPGAPGHLWGFFPGYPLLLRAMDTLIHHPLVAGMVVSGIAELLALYFVVRLVSAERDADDGRFAAWLLALYPYALYLTAVYTESVFCAAAAAALYLMRRGQHGRACLATAVAIAVRSTGVALLPALLIEHWRRRGSGWRSLVPGWLLIAASTAPLWLFVTYARIHVGDAFAYLHAEQSASFNRGFSWPWTGLRATYQTATSLGPSSNGYIFSVELLFGLGGLIVLIALWLAPRIPRSFAAYSTGIWLLAVAQPYWLSVPRYEVGMIPVVLLAADLTRRHPQWRLGVLAVSAGGLVYVTQIMASGRFLA